MAEKKTIDVTDSTFDEVVQKNKYVVVDCWAAWCGPCNMLSPIVEQLANENPEITFGKLNVDQNRKIPMKYGIMSIPTLLYFKEGKLTDKTLGALPKKTLESRLEKLKS
ncbi:thioredoxin [Candidatus Bathyarchaeota archaeon]|nr:thioredoxin [Candidatus Bathyarchaeota archaeon]